MLIAPFVNQAAVCSSTHFSGFQPYDWSCVPSMVLVHACGVRATFQRSHERGCGSFPCLNAALGGLRLEFIGDWYTPCVEILDLIASIQL